MNQAQLLEVASWVGITQGTNSMNLHAVLYSSADKNMVYFLKHCFVCNEYVSEAELGEGTIPLCKPTKTRSSAVVFDVVLAVRPIRSNTFEIN